MADEVERRTAKKYLGVNLDYSDDEDGSSTRRTSSATEPTEQSSEDESPCNSITRDEPYDSIENMAYEFAHKYFDQDTRRSRTPKKPRKTEVTLRQQKAKLSANSSRRTSKDNQQYPSTSSDTIGQLQQQHQQLSTSDGESTAGSDGQIKSVIHKRKRTSHQQRALDRDAKFEATESIVDGQDPNSPQVHSAQQPIPAPQQESVKIDLPNHFRSLNSRPVCPKDLLTDSGAATPLRATSRDCPKDRQDFHELFSLLIRIGNHERKTTEERTFTRQRSQEEQIWQNKLNDVVWLELRAWHNGRSVESEDYALCNERERIDPILKEVMKYRFCPKRRDDDNGSSSSPRLSASPGNDSLFAISALDPNQSVITTSTATTFDDVLEESIGERDGDVSSETDSYVVVDGTSTPDHSGLVEAASANNQFAQATENSESASDVAQPQPHFYLGELKNEDLDETVPLAVSSNVSIDVLSPEANSSHHAEDNSIKHGDRRRNDRSRRPRLDLSKAKLGEAAVSPTLDSGRVVTPLLTPALDQAEQDETAGSGKHPAGEWDPGYVCGGLCNVFCSSCLGNQNDALCQVALLLEKLEDVGRLYPSSRAMSKHWPEVSSKEFNDRVKTLCLYYNMVTDLRQKIMTLGKLLASLGGKSLPWPSFDDGCPFERLFAIDPSLKSAASGAQLDGEPTNEIDDDDDEEEEATVRDDVCVDQPVIEGADDPNRNMSKCVRFQPGCAAPPLFLPPRVAGGGAGEAHVALHVSLDSGIGLAQPSSSSGSSTPSGNLTPNPWVGGSSSRSAKPEGGENVSDPPWTWSSAVPTTTTTTASSSSPIHQRRSPTVPGTPVPGGDAHQMAPTSPAPSCSSSITGAVFNRSLSELSVDASQMPPYRRYVDKLLKQKGLRKLLQRLTQLIQNTLFRARYSLEKRTPPALISSPDLEHLTDEPLSLPMSQTESELSKWESEDWCSELAYYGVWGECYAKLGLPSFRSLYLFLLQIPLEIMHECLQLRLEQQPEDPSFLSIRQLMRECKEAIKASVIIRQKYFRMNRVVLLKHELDKLEQNLTDFDDNVKRMLQSYLRYLQSWVQMLLKSPQQTQKNVLEEEWTFVKVFSRYVQRGEALASEVFCSMASNMLASSGHYLETELDNCTSIHYDRMTSDQDISTPTSNRRHNILMCCRNFKDVFHETRKRALKAIAFSKMLRKDLEIAAEFSIETSVDDLLARLQLTKHVRLIAPHSSNFIIFIPEHIKENRPYLGQLLSMTYGHEHSAAPDNTKSEGYLIVLHCNNCGDVPGSWKGQTQAIEPTAEITITLSQLNVEGLLFVVNHSSQLGTQRKIFQKAMGSNVRVTKEFTSCNQSIADSLMDLKKEALSLRDKITDVIGAVEDKLDMESIGDIDDGGKANLQSSCRELLHQCYKFGFEYHKEITRLVTGESRSKLGPGLILFAKHWMSFVTSKCERGRGMRPRWANQGLDFLITACEPVYGKHLSDSDFVTLKMNMNDCITHLIGSPEIRPSHSGAPGSRSHSPTPRRSQYRKTVSYEPKGSYPRSVSTVSSKSEPTPTPTKNMASSWHADFDVKEKRKSGELVLEDEVEANLSEDGMPMERIRREIGKLEKKRELTLQNEGMIGRVSDVSVETTVQISARRVTFHWQRGFKIGQGRFGKVYAAVNSGTGDLMALKEIHLQPNDHKTIKDVADELRIFEGIRHPYLVRYYGVEIHREEMFIFMEFCSCGTLESASHEVNLPEELIRKYTRQLLEAVNVLHEHGIVHRDIKGANIFLTSDGNLKLGDFGCCIKLKNHTTMPGELNAFVGTQAFMAPEVFTKSVTEGHGRAADIWSVGCVVIEMATGKRPWHELENHYQIMFKVGTGVMPEIPSNLSEEGQDFLSHCFQFEPKDRWTASRLLDSPFTKVDSEEECQSMTFLPEVSEHYKMALSSSLL